VSKTSISIQELDQLIIEEMSTESVPPLTPDDIVDLLAKAITRKSEAEEEIITLREMLALLRKQGVIGDELSHPELTLKWQTRSSWVYSPAVKQVQQMEQAEGVATKKTTEGWVVRKTPAPQF
jgi:hypothetical protein